MMILRIAESLPARSKVRLRLVPDGIEEPGIKTVIFDPHQDPLLNISLQARHNISFDEGRPIVQVDGVTMHLERLEFQAVFTAGTGAHAGAVWTISTGGTIPNRKTKSGRRKTAKTINNPHMWLAAAQDSEMWMTLAWE